MPSSTPKQARLMAGCAHNPESMSNCPPMSVAKEFNQADKGTGILKRKKVVDAMMMMRRK